ncbi:MAG TPA: hypothetical protein VKV24_10745 [Casimicrobiaceae bacterium]|nr:hypothetical protein [Casimicrobiaceae bacterium]
MNRKMLAMQNQVDHITANTVRMVSLFNQPPAARIDANGNVQLHGGPRYYAELLLVSGKLAGIKEPDALVQQCIAWARQRAAHYGNTPAGQALVKLAELFERHPKEANVFVQEWEASAKRQMGGVS